MEKGIIAIITDFGLDNWYPGVMRGSILDVNPGARIVDLCHNITKHDICEAGFVLGISFSYFPRGTIFLCVVDPGVGGERNNLIVETGDYLFVAPDNGLLSVISNKVDVKSAYSVEVGEFTRDLENGTTFLGRDIFAPIAGHLSLGTDPEKMGEKVDSILTIPLRKPYLDKSNTIMGKAEYIDSFGNIITNVSLNYLNKVFGDDIPWNNCLIRIAGSELAGISRYYAQSSRGELVALINSWGYLEIAVNCGSAYEYLGRNDKDSMEIRISSNKLHYRSADR